jgi:SAM-dependent methyltransferase
MEHAVDFKPSLADHDGAQLLVGCGNGRKRLISVDGTLNDFDNLVTLDMNPACDPDYVWDLRHLPYPFKDSQFSEVHAYEVLEHIGAQGDYKTFFAQFDEFWRILKPDGLMFVTVPMWDSVWAWGDPGHTRVINVGTITFLSRKMYDNVGSSPMSDYRNDFVGDFQVLSIDESTDRFMFVLKALK